MHINRRIERFLILYNYPASKFGRIVASDPRLVADIRRGRELRADMIAKADAFMDHYACTMAPEIIKERGAAA
jgi:hypothetical protein